MSIKVMSWVWEEGPADQAECFVLLALADFANDAGECWPSIPGIARKVRMKERGVRQIVRRLEAGGWLTTSISAARAGANHYRIVRPTPGTVCPTPAPHAPLGREMPPAPHAAPRHQTALTPAPHAPEPSGTVRVEVGAGREREPALLSRVLEAVGLNPNDRLPTHWMPPTADMHVQRWVSAGIPADTVVEIAAENRKRHPDPPNGPKALDHAMRAWLAASAAPAFSAPVIPLETGHPDARRSSRPSRSDAALRAFLSGA